ncbi:TPA: restriction endonuclease subunit S [Streptococcus equi subsp. zooepidemicus]|nr:restriction endonuclease subunit S [Streptococcus equi]MDI5957857.1 restriction endonuclease subunit S [Streptococcus equi subsp. zooepidemicus]HEL1237068.1 restriction endonuclease subunit S [Streptococcus equi subsp. zooepidemicus]HEL1289971.1 restriction endonuclease subunit S [Streptococcus equi subsp. zooepidemicus]
MNDWKWVKLSEIIDFNPKERLLKGSISKKIAMEKIEPFTRDISEFERLEFKGGTKFRNGDTLIARITPSLENGKTAKVNLLDEDEIGFGSTEFIVARAKKGISDENFVYYLMLDPKVREVAIKSMVGTSGRQRVQLDVVKNYEILCPPLEEQIQIGRILSVIDDKIENNKKINHHLEEIGTAIWQEKFRNKVPNGTLGDIASISNGKRPPVKAAEPTYEEKIPILGASSVMGYTNQTLYHQKILVTGRVGTHGIIQRYQDSCWPSDNTLVLQSNYYEFVYQILKNIDFTAMNRGSTQPLITQTDLKKNKIYIPAANELANFEIIVGTHMKQYERNNIENDILSNLRNTLLPKLLSGELSITQATK